MDAWVVKGGSFMEQVEQSAQQSVLPAPILKDKRAWWLYLIPIIAVAALPLVVVIGLFLLAGAHVEMPGELVTAVVSLAATALGGIVNQLLSGDTSGQ